MGRFKLDKAGISKIRSMLQHQVTETQKKLACETYDFFVNFAYKKDGSGGVKAGGDGYTLYYLSNWNVGINGIDEAVLPSYRITTTPDGGVNQYSVDREKAKWITDAAEFGDTISVTNSVDYGLILNDGGFFNDYYFGNGDHKWDNFCIPNRFLEQCIDHIEQNANKIIQQVAKECPEL